MSTKIEWCTETWNWMSGCDPTSEGCEHCYAKRMSKRLAGRFGYPADDPFKVTLHEDKFDQPSRWKKPRRIFVCSMGDMFHSDIEWPLLDRMFFQMMKNPQHIYMILTKRIETAWYYFGSPVYGTSASRCQHLTRNKNIWLGVTAENQARADERIPILLQIPAAVRFISVEPMLGPMNLWSYYQCKYCEGTGHLSDGDSLAGDRPTPCPGCKSKIDWVICGRETGPGAREMKIEWPNHLKGQCDTAKVPFFFKNGPKHFQEYPNDQS